MSRTGKIPFKPRLTRPERRVLIERAAAELFAARGYSGASIDEIARAAGVTKRVIYDHFDSKAALHNALLEGQADELIRYVSARHEPHLPAGDRMASTVEAFYRFVEEHPFAWRMLFRDAPGDPSSAEVHRRVQERATRMIMGLLAADPHFRAAAAGRGPQWLEMTAELVKAALNGLAGWWYGHRDVPRQQIVAAALDLAWTGLRAFTRSSSRQATS